MTISIISNTITNLVNSTCIRVLELAYYSNLLEKTSINSNEFRSLKYCCVVVMISSFSDRERGTPLYFTQQQLIRAHNHVIDYRNIDVNVP